MSIPEGYVLVKEGNVEKGDYVEGIYWDKYVTEEIIGSPISIFECSIYRKPQDAK